MLTIECPNCGYQFKSNPLHTGTQKFQCGHCSHNFEAPPESNKLCNCGSGLTSPELESARKRIDEAATESKRTLVKMKLKPFLDRLVFDLTDEDAQELAEKINDIQKECDPVKMQHALRMIAYHLMHD